MGKKGSWLHTVKKAFGAQSTEKNKEAKKTQVDKDDAYLNDETSTAIATTDPINDATIPPSEAQLNQETAANKIQTAFRNHSFRRSTSEVIVENSEAARIEVDRPSKLNEEVAATKIQTIFRQSLSNKHSHPITVARTVSDESVSEKDHPIDMHGTVRSESSEENAADECQETMGTKTSESLNGLRRIKSYGEGQSIKGKTKIPKRVQSLSPPFSTTHSQRPKISEEMVPQRKLPKHDKSMDKLKVGEMFDGSATSKEQIKAKMNHNQVAAMRREKALAFASNVQQSWKNSKNSKTSNSIAKKPNKSQLGRSYSEQWRVSQQKEEKNTIKRFNSLSIKGEIDWNNDHTIQDLSLHNKPSMAPQKPRRQSSFTPTRRSSPLPPGS